NRERGRRLRTTRPACRTSHLDLRALRLWPGARRAGLAKAEPGADAGSAAGAQGVLVFPIPPLVLQAPHNPPGPPQSLFDGFIQSAQADPPAWMKGFLDNFYNYDALGGTLVSEQAFRTSFNLAVSASAAATVACIPTWLTDFRADLPNIDVPILVI